MTKRSLPVRTSREDYVETIPELVVEVRSKNDRRSELRAKAEEYLRAGVQIVWVIDHAAKTVTVYRPKEGPLQLHDGDTLTAKGVIPGFKVLVAELYSAHNFEAAQPEIKKRDRGRLAGPPIRTRTTATRGCKAGDNGVLFTMQRNYGTLIDANLNDGRTQTEKQNDRGLRVIRGFSVFLFGLRAKLRAL